MRPINEDEAEVLFEEHLRERGWNLTDFRTTRKRWREHLDGEEADRVFLHEGKLVAILEAKKPGKDLWAALEQAKGYARAYRKNTRQDVPLLFASGVASLVLAGCGGGATTHTVMTPSATGANGVTGVRKPQPRTTNIVTGIGPIAFTVGTSTAFAHTTLMLEPVGYWRGAVGFLLFAIALRMMSRE